MVINSNKLIRAGKEMKIPLIVTEHYPEKLGKIVPQLDISHGAVFSKTLFSMMTPEVEKKLKENSQVDSVVLLGLEVIALSKVDFFIN